MKGRELVRKAIRNEETPRIPWVPYVGCHGGFLIDKTAREYLSSGDLLLEGLRKARKLYRPDGLPVIFDLQVEAEVLGCELKWSDDGPPAVVSHPLEGKPDWKAEDVSLLDMKAGRIPMVMETSRLLREEFGDETALYGLICGPFTLALHLRGNGIFLDMFDDPDGIRDLLLRCARIGKQMADGYLDQGCDVIGVVDPMTSQISPEHFERFVAPAMNDLYDHIRERDGLSSCFVCGDVTRNLEAMCRTRSDSISVDEQIDLAKMRELAAAHDTSFGGNLKLTLSLLLGTEADCKLNAIECIERGGSRGFLLSPGCDLPYNTPVANVAAAGLMATDPYQREVAAETCRATEADSFDDVVPPDYENESNVILDLITLDSETCAPCQYMKVAADEAAAEFSGRVEVREHKIKDRRGIGMLVKLGVTGLPAICIDGTPAFVSIIPEKPKLVATIRERVDAKA